MPETLRVPAALSAVFAHLDAWPALAAILGPPPVVVMATDDLPTRYPELQYMVISAPMDENLGAVTVQFDAFGRTADEAAAITAALFAALHAELRRDYGGMPLVVRYEDSRQMPEPERGKAHESSDYRIIFGREI